MAGCELVWLTRPQLPSREGREVGSSNLSISHLAQSSPTAFISDTAYGAGELERLRLATSSREGI